MSTSNPASVRRPELSELLLRAASAGAATVHVSIPAKVNVVRTDANGNITDVDCEVTVYDWGYNEQGALVAAPVAIVPHVAVATPGGGGQRLTIPVQAGDLGHLVFFERSVDRYMAGSGVAVDPELYSRFNPTDATFVPGLRPFGAPWASWPSDHATLGADDGAQVHFRKNVITVGDESGSKAIGLHGDEVDMGTWTVTPGAGPLAGAIASISIVPPGGGAPIVLSPATPGPVALKGKLVASATQAKAK